MGKKRHTAKTGDKGLHKSTQRSNINDTVNIGDNDNDSDNKDPLYNEVDRFHNEKDKDFLKLDQQDNGDDDDSEGDDVQEDAVMDLGLGDAYSEDDEGDDDDDSSDDDNDMGTKNDEEEDDDDDEEEAMPFSPSDDEEEEMEDNIRDWGRKKSAYYSGDNTADLEIGQDGDDDGDDALLEEEAAKQVQAARFQSMTEDDFLLSDQEQDDDDDTARQGIASGVIDSTGKGLITSSRDVAKLSNRDKQKLLDKQHPEFLPLLSHFTAIAKDLRAKTRVATKAVFFGEAETATSIGATLTGQRYLLSKALLQSSAALNLAMYLVLKIELADVAEPGVIQNHPVIRHLQKLNSLIQSLEDGIETSAVNLTGQLKKLVQAAALLDGSNIDESNDGGIDESDEEDDSDESNSPHHADITKSDRGLVTNFEENDKDDESSDDETTTRRDVLTEARFGLRQKELLGSTENLNKRHGRNGRMLSYAGDDDDEFDESQHKSISRTLSTTINSIEQRTATRQRNSTPLVEHLDDHDVDDGELRRGLEMMEDELGKASDDEQEMGESQENLDRGDYDTEEDDFYNKISNKSKEQKAARKNIYSVAPKFPRVENEIEGERAINRTILKNRGLVAHKAKINRNPRVKKREQYRKAIIRRKGAVRDVRTDEGHKYGGEGTGIKSGLSRSRKLAH